MVSQKILSISTTVPSPGGQTSGIASHEHCCGEGGASRRSPQGLPRGAPRTSLGGLAGGGEGWLPPGHRVVGLRQIDGMPHRSSVQDRFLGPSPGRRTSRSSEKPGELARAFHRSSPLHHPSSARWRSAARTSWPISRIQSGRVIFSLVAAVTHIDSAGVFVETPVGGDATTDWTQIVIAA